MEWLVSVGEAALKVLDNPAVFLGLIALLGLLLQRKGVGDVITGTLRTVVGLLVFQAGAGLLVGGILPINTMLQNGLNISGVYPFNEPAFVEYMAIISQTIVSTFIIGWVLHIILVRIIPAFRCVFLTAHMMLFTSTLTNVGVYMAFGLRGMPLVLVSAVICAIWWSISPQWAYKYSKEFVGDEFTLGHHITLGCVLGAEIGKRFFNKEDDADRLSLPGWLSTFQDATMNTAITMPIFFFIVGLVSGIPTVKEMAGGQIWWIYLILQGLQFAAGLTVLLIGVRQFLAAIVPAFKGWADKVIPGAVPALDMPVFFPSSPMGTVFGFLGGAAGMILVSVVLFLLKSPLFVFPSLIMAFFEPGAEGVFANKFGGWKAAVVTGFIGGVIFSVGILWLQPLTADLAGTGTQFGNIDTVAIFAPFYWILYAIGGLFGVNLPIGTGF
jgi:PTS system ascorbate-specific IIC component